MSFEQIFDGASRQLGEGIVGGGKDGERTITFKRVDQSGSL